MHRQPAVDQRSPDFLESLRTRVTEPVDKELSIGDPRSAEYRKGMLDVMATRALGLAWPKLPYKVGTAQADAYFAGIERGNALFRRLIDPQTHI